MAEAAPELSPSELAALDFAIAYMKDNDQAALGSFGTILAAVAKSFREISVPAIATIGGLKNTLVAAPQIVTAGTGVAEAAGTAAVANSADLQSVVQQVQESARKLEGLTLDDLIRIRNQYGK